MAHLPIKFTQDLTPYKELGVPCFMYKHNWLSNGYQFPFKLQFNRTYYKHDGNGLIAFRILAYSFCDERNNDYDFPMYYLVQLPNKPLQWIKNFITPQIKVYNSVDDYVLSGGGEYVNLGWHNWHYNFATYQIHNDTKFFNRDYWTIKNGAVVRSSQGAWMNMFVATEDGFFVNIANTSYRSSQGEDGIYLDKMVATRTLLKDMQVTDFENEPITIKMNVLDNTPKYTKIMFVE
jgi:hypothetical protein